MVFYTDRIADEVKELPLTDVSLIYQALHIAIADELDHVEIRLNYFRDGENLKVSKFDYMDLYQSLAGLVTK